MKALSVLHVDGGRNWGGGQNQVRLLMRELAQQGVDQLCVCPRGSALAERLQDAGLPVRAVRWRRGVDVAAFFAIAGALKGRAIVHCHDAHALQLALLPARLRGVHVVAARRVAFSTRPLKWNRADRVIAVSNTVRLQLLESGVHEARIRVIHSGIDVEESRAVAPLRPAMRERLGIPRSAFLAGNTGHLYESKGQVHLAEAAAFARDVHWVIAGEGPSRAEIEAAIALHDVANNVHLTGWLDDARPLMHELNAYVSPAAGEALGTSILEAMANEVPVVAANIGGPGELLAPVHERTGASLVERRDGRALAEAVKRIRDDDALRARVVAAQNQRLADFAIVQTARKTLDVYQELLRDG